MWWRGQELIPSKLNEANVVVYFGGSAVVRHCMLRHGDQGQARSFWIAPDYSQVSSDEWHALECAELVPSPILREGHVHIRGWTIRAR